MRVLFIRPNLTLPERYAGTELTLHHLCRSLIAHGHQVMLAATTATLTSKSPAVIDQKLGYPVIRAWNGYNSAFAAVERFRPDVLVASHSGDWMKHLKAFCEIPLVIYEQEVAIAATAAPDAIKKRAVYLANSDATAAFLSSCGFEGTIVPPLFGIEDYVGIERTGDEVLFVSLQLRKGADVAIAIARARPGIRFLFVESWTENPQQTEGLREEVARIPNITLLPNQSGLLHIMPRIKLHLMPSRSREAWGRTASEAQVCGIPVLGSSRGNLPVTIGPGGMTLDPDEPIELWLEKFDAMMNDAVLYRDLSQKARAHGLAVVAQERRAYDTFEQALAEAVAKVHA